MKKPLIAALLLSLQVHAYHPEAETLLGSMTSHLGVHIQVRSNGCTWKDDFQVVRESDRGVVQITFYRKQMDSCKAYLPYGRVITYGYSELGLKPGDQFHIVNGRAHLEVSEF